MYLIINGADGSGKDTQFEMIKGLFFEPYVTREPGGNEEAEIIRDVLLSNENPIHQKVADLQALIKKKKIDNESKEMVKKAVREMESARGVNGEAEMYLFAASRIQNNLNKLASRKRQGRDIIGRRSVACSMAYQGKARGMGMNKVWEVNRRALEICSPDLEIYIDVPVEERIRRIAKRSDKQDRLDLETEEFHRLSEEGYVEYYEKYCPYEYVRVDGAKSQEHVNKEIKKILRRKNIV